MNEMCGDNRFEIIARAKKHLLDATNIDTSADEMKVLDDFLYRCWQMGWLDRYDTADTPQTENPCDGCVCDDGKHLMYCMNCKGIAWKTEPPKVADTPQTDCENCELDGKADVCKICRVSNYEPQTDCGWK